MKPHILVVSQYFYPESFRINDICKEWIKRGYKVTVLTGIPNYPQGQFYDGYSFRKKRREKWNGIDVIRIPLIPRGRHTVGLIANYFSFVVSGFIWMLFTKIKADFVFTFAVSPMTQALIGVWYSKKHNIPNYIYVQDLWPENVEAITGIHSPVIIKPIKKMVDYIYKNCTHIFATSRSFVAKISKLNANFGQKVHYWPQYAEDFYIPLEKTYVSEIPNDEFCKIIFTGNIGYAQGLEILPETAKILKRKGIKVKFCIVGNGRYLEKFLNEISDIKDMFIMIPHQPAERIPVLLAACDAAFLSFKNISLFEMTIPAKLQSYMACGMPIIASASGESKKIIEEAQCGYCSKTGKVDELVEKIELFCQMRVSQRAELSKNAYSYYKEHFYKEKLMDYMDMFFE